MTKNTVLCLFLSRDHVFCVTVPLPGRYFAQGVPLPKRDSPFLKKDAVLKSPVAF
jgi:hypothetical protein